MFAYVDSSVLVRVILKHENAFQNYQMFEEIYSSILFKIEVSRTIERFRLEGILTDDERVNKVRTFHEMMDHIYEIPFVSLILRRAAESFPTIISTLDAIHLASAWWLREEKKVSPIFLTHDQQLGKAAMAMGFETLGI